MADFAFKAVALFLIILPAPAAAVLARKACPLCTPKTALRRSYTYKHHEKAAMQSLNHAIFLALNADESSPLFLIAIARLLAELPIALAALMALYILVRRRSEKAVAVRLVFTVTLAMAAAWVIRRLHYNPRPFVIDLGRTLIDHAPTASFPSFHGTFLFSLAAALLFCPKERASGAAMLLLGLATAWARIYLGVHYPLDMLGALIIAFAAAAAVHCCILLRRQWT